jgi:uncharacterized protein YggT (Ycf19 family)
MSTAVQVLWEILLWVFILRVFVDFFPPLQENAFGRLVMRLSEPALAPLRRIFHPFAVGEATVDVASVIVVLVLYYLRALLF